MLNFQPPTVSRTISSFELYQKRGSPTEAFKYVAVECISFFFYFFLRI